MNPEVLKLTERMRESADKLVAANPVGDKPTLAGGVIDLRQGANTIEDQEQQLAIVEKRRGERLGRMLSAAFDEWFLAEFGVEPKMDMQMDTFPGQISLIISRQWVELGMAGAEFTSQSRDVRINVGVRMHG